MEWPSANSPFTTGKSTCEWSSRPSSRPVGLDQVVAVILELHQLEAQTVGKLSGLLDRIFKAGATTTGDIDRDRPEEVLYGLLAKPVLSGALRGKASTCP